MVPTSSFLGFAVRRELEEDVDEDDVVRSHVVTIGTEAIERVTQAQATFEGKLDIVLGDTLNITVLEAELGRHFRGDDRIVLGANIVERDLIDIGYGVNEEFFDLVRPH